MINFDEIIRLAAKASRDTPVVAAPYPLPDVTCHELAAAGLIKGYLADNAQNPAHPDPSIAGWWVDRQEGVWFLRHGYSRTIILLSVEREEQISGRMLLEARLKGCERILLVGADGAVAEEIAVVPALLRRLGSAAPPERTNKAYRAAPRFESSGVADWQAVNTPTEGIIGGAVRDDGHCFVADLPTGPPDGGYHLWEDDKRLGLPFSAQHDIRAAGQGRYAVTGGQILFSSSDLSDVRFNGRIYRLRPDTSFEEIVVRPRAMTAEIGHCHIAYLGLADRPGRLTLWEDDVHLGPPASLHAEIRTHGTGRYSVWGSDLYFSSSDNSDPRKNGRAYVLRREKQAISLHDEGANWVGVRPERALRHMLEHAVPRRDFVPGRIVHLIGSLGPGGGERQALYTLTGIASQPFESVQLLCYNLHSGDERHDFYLPALASAGVPARTIRRQLDRDDPISMPPSLREIRSALPKELAHDIADLFWEFVSLRPEIVHAWLDGNNIRAGLAAALAGVPRIIVSGRSVSPIHFALYESYMDPAYAALLELPQVMMINNSQAGRDDYARWLGIEADRIRVIHNGCDFPAVPSDETRRRSREAYKIAPDTIVIGTVTRLSEEKRPHLFIEMAQHALRRQHNLRFLIFGTGPLRAELQTLINDLRIAMSVTLMGVTNDVWAALAAMDVFVLTSRMEGLPNVLIEAQCSGIPVVATTVGGAAETFIEGKTGFGIGNATPEALTEALLRLTLDPKRRRDMSDAASTFAREEFSVGRMMARTLQLYKSESSSSQGARPVSTTTTS